MENDSEERDLLSKIQILEERIKGNRELLEEKLRSFRNIVMAVTFVLALIGVSSIYIIIVNVVKDRTEKRLDDILTEDYMDKKITIKSKATIDKINRNIYAKAKEAVDKYSSYNELLSRSRDAFYREDYEESARNLKNAIDKIDDYKYGGPQDRQGWLYAMYANLSFTYLLYSDYNSAISSLRESRNFLDRNSDDYSSILVNAFIECAIAKIMRKDYSDVYANFNNTLKNIGQGNWNTAFDEYYEKFDKWIKYTNLGEDNKLFIMNMVDLIKKKKLSKI